MAFNHEPVRGKDEKAQTFLNFLTPLSLVNSDGICDRERGEGEREIQKDRRREGKWKEKY